MSRRVHIRDVRRDEIDLDKLVFALLRLAREQLEQDEPTPPRKRTERGGTHE